MVDTTTDESAAAAVGQVAELLLSNSQVQAKLQKISPAIAPVVELYAPVITRLAAEDFFALVGMVQAGRGVEAQAMLRSKMTTAELAAEEAALSGQLTQMAAASAEARQMWGAVLETVVKAAIGVALAGMGV